MTGGALLLWILAGAGSAILLGCLPGFHVYNLIAVLLLAVGALPPGTVPPEAFAALAAAAVSAWSITGILPMIFLSAPDESTTLMMPAAQAAFQRGQGKQAALYVAGGGLLGAVLVLAALPFLPAVLPLALTVLRPHFHWILWAVILYLPLSEWPKGGLHGQAGWRRLGDGARSWLAGLLTLLLSGALGWLIMNRPVFPPDRAAQSLAPALVGLFAIPALLQACLGRADAVPQKETAGGLGLGAWLAGTFTGAAGGAFAALMPGVTGGLGALVAGQASAQNDDRAFLASQGASRMVYYAGSLLLFALPGVSLVRGGAAWQVQSLCPAGRPGLLLLLAAAVALGAALAFLAQGPLASALARLCPPRRVRAVSLAALALLLGLIGGTTGWMGLAVATVAAGIGSIPLLYHSRRLNALGVVLVPVAWRMTAS